MARCGGCGRFYRFQYDDAEAICEPCLEREERRQAAFADRIERKQGVVLSSQAVLMGYDECVGECRGLR